MAFQPYQIDHFLYNGRKVVVVRNIKNNKKSYFRFQSNFGTPVEFELGLAVLTDLRLSFPLYRFQASVSISYGRLILSGLLTSLGQLSFHHALKETYQNASMPLSTSSLLSTPCFCFFAFDNHNFCNHRPANIYLFKVNNRNTRKRCEICSKLTIKTPERRLTSFWCFYS